MSAISKKWCKENLDVVLASLLLILDFFRIIVFIVDFEQVNVCWERTASAEIRVFINNFDRVFACWAMNLLQNHSILF